MKALSGRFFILAVLLVAFAACTMAQTATPTLAFTAPGPFIAGDASFPAGSYTIHQTQEEPNVWEISSDTKTHNAFVSTVEEDALSPYPKTEVTFRKYGNTLILKEVLIGAQTIGYVVLPGHAEKQAAKSGKPTKVSVPATKK